MKIGYAGASSADDDAGHAAQPFELKSAGCARIYQERFAGRASARPRLRAMLDCLKPGDTVIVTKLDRLARSAPDLLDIASRIKAKGAGLLVLDLVPIDSRPADKDLIPVVLGAIAGLDRRAAVERGVEPAPRPRPRPEAPLRPGDEAEVRRLRAEGKGPAAIARKLRIGRASVYGALVARAPA